MQVRQYLQDVKVQQQGLLSVRAEGFLMTALRESAIDLIKKVPEDRLYYIVQLINDVNKLYETDDASVKENAFSEPESIRRETTAADYAAELAE